MQSNIVSRGRVGWTPEEQQLLWHEVERASVDGHALRTVFDNVARQTGRKPNSIRNYYYVSVKDGEAPEGISCQRALPFTPFEDEELHLLVRQILVARSRGISVRACVMQMGDGDRSKTLRYQNKYRSVLKNRPEYVKQVMQELSAEGITFGEDFTPVRKRKYSTQTRVASPSRAMMRLVETIEQSGEGGAILIDALCDFLLSEKEACIGAGDGSIGS